MVQLLFIEFSYISIFNTWKPAFSLFTLLNIFQILLRLRFNHALLLFVQCHRINGSVWLQVLACYFAFILYLSLANVILENYLTLTLRSIVFNFYSSFQVFRFVNFKGIINASVAKDTIFLVSLSTWMDFTSNHSLFESTSCRKLLDFHIHW